MIGHLAETLRAYRKEAGLTQTELAEKAGVSLETIWKTEKGKSYPRLDVCVAIAGALGCTTSELIGERPAGDIAALKDIARGVLCVEKKDGKIKTLTFDRMQEDPLRYWLTINGKVEGTMLTLDEIVAIIAEKSEPDGPHGN